MIWQLGELTRLSWRNFGTEWLLFDQGTGQTLLLDSLSAAALMALETGPLSGAEIEQQVASDLDLPAPAEHRAVLSESLRFLAELNLIGSRTCA
ncbi:HPr-rel-A system PqqD family peptide chaperone [Roseateles sp.]|uniref:HPr-rel-A system PqqD family peptide chaperone n=1 Tax=Roseateles sp. TaxID=1971397 RepID=UPI00286D1C8C|nr:HPr-rel-A system PqqD family peptide chaperone [Roseateles sp.]